MKHISDSERLTNAILRKREEQIQNLQETIDQYKEQLKTMTSHITELKGLNKVLCNQIYSLTHKVNED